jgi:hypothetical protein
LSQNKIHKNKDKKIKNQIGGTNIGNGLIAQGKNLNGYILDGPLIVHGVGSNIPNGCRMEKCKYYK